MWGADEQPVPTLKSPVTDLTGTLKPDQISALERTLYLEADRSEDAGIAAMRPGILAALKALP